MKKNLKLWGLDGVIVTNAYNISYFTSFYGFSDKEREAFLLITRQKGFIITDGRYKEAVKKEVADFILYERGPDKSFPEILKEISRKYKIKYIGFEENDLTLEEFKILKNKLGKDVRLTPAGKYLKDLRITKTAREISCIKKACALGDMTFEYILPKLRVGVAEKQIALELELFIKKKGAELSFSPIIAYGANSSMPHHQTGETGLKKNQIVLLDFGVKFENYCSDMTRTVFFGKPTRKQKEIYQTVLNAQQKAIEELKAGAKASNIDKIARKYIIKKGYPSIPHSLGHGIGLEIHEAPHLSPKSKDLLKTGMVFTIEPGIYIPGFGGVRIEDVFLLEKNGPKPLTHSPKHLIEI